MYGTSTNIEIIESKVLATILLDNRTISIVREILKTDDFYCEHCKRIYEAMCSLSDNGESIDLATISARLINDPVFNNAGGVCYLANITSDLPTADAVETYANNVRTESIKRKLSHFADTLKVIAANPCKDIDGTIASLSQDLLEFSTNNRTSQWKSLSDNVVNAFQIITTDSKDNVIKSGFTDIDNMLRGFRPGTLTIIAGRPAMGKTALGVNVMVNATMNQKVPVAFFSLEMSGEELALRCIAMHSKVNSSAIAQKRMTEAEWQRVLDSVEWFHNSNCLIDETPAIEISTLRERAKRLQMQNGIKLLIVDYLQLIRSNNRRVQIREQEIADISRTLKAIAKELNIAVIAMAQLNREAERRVTHRPVMSDLRESGSVEQDADVIMLIHREDYYKPMNERDNTAEIIIAKNRHGSDGCVKLHWDGEYTLFSNLEQYEY
jgi:replicative DNA helicase